MIQAADLPARFAAFHKSLEADGCLAAPSPLFLPVAQRLYKFLHDLKGSFGISDDPVIRGMRSRIEAMVDWTRGLAQAQTALNFGDETRVIAELKKPQSFDSVEALINSITPTPHEAKPNTPEQQKAFGQITSRLTTPLDAFAKARLMIALQKELVITDRDITVPLLELEKKIKEEDHAALIKGGMLMLHVLRPRPGSGPMVLDVTFFTALPK